jgi:hypothetical protein
MLLLGEAAGGPAAMRGQSCTGETRRWPGWRRDRTVAAQRRPGGVTGEEEVGVSGQS